MASGLENFIKRKRDVERTRRISKLDYTCTSGGCFIPRTTSSLRDARRFANCNFQRPTFTIGINRDTLYNANLPKGKIYIFPFHMYLELDSSYLRSAHTAGHKRIFTTASYYVRFEASVHQDVICQN